MRFSARLELFTGIGLQGILRTYGLVTVADYSNDHQFFWIIRFHGIALFVWWWKAR